MNATATPKPPLGLGLGTIPPSYQQASLRTVLGMDTDGNVALSFDVPGLPTIRLRLEYMDAVRLMGGVNDALFRYLLAGTQFQSLMSSGIPSSDGSPQEGQSV